VPESVIYDVAIFVKSGNCTQVETVPTFLTSIQRRATVVAVSLLSQTDPTLKFLLSALIGSLSYEPKLVVEIGLIPLYAKGSFPVNFLFFKLIFFL